MKIRRTIQTVCGFVFTFIFLSPADSGEMPIDSMNITGGSVTWSLPGGTLEEDLFAGFGPNTNLVGGYIGNGGASTLPFDPPDPNNIIFFTFIDGLNSVVTYTAASNLGSTVFPADVLEGGPVPTGIVDDTSNTIELDMSSWFGNINNATDVWAGTGLDDGYTSPVATGTWNPITFEYELSWNSRTPDGPYNPFPGLTSTWNLTGYAYPPVPISILIDIKPGSPENPVNPGSRGNIPVVIGTTEDFDASNVDVNTVQFGPDAARPVHYALADVDGDTDWDLMLQFKTQDTGIVCGDTEATLTGKTLEGESFTGADSIKTVGCK